MKSNLFLRCFFTISISVAIGEVFAQGNNYIDGNNNGNANSKIGFTNSADLKLITKDSVRQTITKDGDIIIEKTLKVKGRLIADRMEIIRIAPVEGDSIIAFGKHTIILNTNQNNIGWTPVPNGPKGLSIGNGAYAGGANSMAVGNSAWAIGSFSMAIGNRATTAGVNSFALGNNIVTNASATNSFVIGSGVNSSNFLVNDKINSLMVGFNSTIPTLFVGASTGIATIGKVGIGTTNPGSLFSVSGSASIGSAYATLVGPINGLLVQGAVGIGTDLISNTGNYKLSVNGNIRAKKVVVETNWSDFVFEKNYELKSLHEVEQYIKQNGHLSEIPSAKEVENNGGDLGELIKLQMQKIEELTLYLIQLDHKVNKLQSENEELKRLFKK